MKPLLMITASAVLAGCASTGMTVNTQKLFNGDHENVAYLEVSTTKRVGGIFDGKTTRAQVVSVNGSEVDPDVDQVAILPGNHAVNIVCWDKKSDDPFWYENLDGVMDTTRITLKAGQTAELELTEAPSLEGPTCDTRFNIGD